MNRFFAAYSKTALVVVNTVLIGLFACLVIEGALALRGLGRPSVTPSREMDLGSFREVDGGRAKAIADELDRYASSQPFAFNPWTTFMQRPYASETITVEDDPVLTHRRVPAPAAQPAERFVVWAFGGSTMFGWGVDDEHTIAALLQQELQRQTKRFSVEVVNFGQPYWYSSSEVAAFMALLRSRPSPDAVVFLDGLNDASWISSGLTGPVMAGQAAAAWERQRADAMKALPWFSANASFPPLRIVEWLRYRGALPAAAEPGPARKAPADPAQAIIDTYSINRDLAQSLAAAAGVKSYFFLQPVPWLGEWNSGTVNRDFQFGSKEQAVKAMTTLAKDASQSKARATISLTEALRDLERPFVDGTHYSDAGNRILAQRMAKAMAADLR